MAPLPALASRLLQSSIDLAGPALASAAQRRDRRRAAATVVRAIGGSPGSPIFPAEAPHPLLPSAVRVERSRQRAHNSVADQVAVTLWFREGPDLPGTVFSHNGGGGQLGRIALRVGAGIARAGVGLAGAAALGAATVAANRLEAARQPRRITPGR
ncbi:MAG TPA: hypothetical protein VF112_00920 [Candidatus Dormibacteraeota bacterium]